MTPRPDQESRWITGSTTTVAILVIAAFLCIQALIGGTRLLFSLPACGILAIAGLLASVLTRSNKPAPDQWCLWTTLLFMTYVLGRAFFSPVPYLARFDIYPVLAGLLVYFLVSFVLTDSRMRLFILAALLAAAIAQVIVGAIQFRHGDNFMPFAFLQRFDYGRRASGFYICPNHLAGLLEVVGIFGLSLTVWSRWPAWAKLLTGYATVMCYIGVILTASRGGYLSVLGSLLVFLLLSARIVRATGSTLRLRIGLAALVMAVLASLAVVAVIKKSDFLTDRTSRVADQTDIRLKFWRAAVDQWKSSPLLGTGSRTYLFYGRKYRGEQVQLDPVYVHNDYLHLLSEYGAVGFALFVPFFLAHLRRGWITARRLGPKRIAVSHRIGSNAMALNVGALGALAAYAVHSVFDFNLHIPANVLLMAFVFGILANSGVAIESPAPRGAFARLIPRALLLALSLTIAIQAWRLLPGEYFGEKARTSLRDYRPYNAIAFAQKGIGRETRNPLLYYYLGRARMLVGDNQPEPAAAASFYRAALPAFVRARELAPFDQTYALELAFTYDALNRFEEAEAMYREALDFDSKSQSVKRYYEAHLERWKTNGTAPRPEAPPPVQPDT